jgi:aminopeptidase N
MYKLSAFLFLLCACTGRAQTAVSGGALSPLQANMDIRHYTIALDVNPKQKSIAGYAVVDLLLKQAAPEMPLQLYSQYKVSAVTVNAQPVSFTHENNLVTISAATAFAAGKQQIKILYSGQPPVAKRPPWNGGFTWSKDKQGNPWIAVTCQLEGAQIYFPCKDHPSDEPNEGADLMITVPKGLTVAGPGLLKETTAKKGKTTFHWQTKYTINNYCIVFNVGRFILAQRPYTTIAGNKLPMQFYVLAQDSAQAPGLLRIMEQSCRMQEKYFGEYPWAKEKIGVCQTPHLGMEHQTLNAYGNNFRYTKVNGQDFDWLLHHEFGHEWWANKVSNKDWAHMWIQEGICSFGDALFYLEAGGEAAYRKKMKEYALGAQNKLPIVQGDTVDSDKAYIGDVYGKAAFFMHSLRCVMGDSLLFAAVKTLATSPATTYDNMVTTQDVEQLFSRMAGKSLLPYFNLFLRTTSKVTVLVKKDAGDRYLIKLLNLDMPLPIDVKTSGGTQRLTVTPQGIAIKSSAKPLLDPDGYYMLKEVNE